MSPGASRDPPEIVIRYVDFASHTQSRDLAEEGGRGAKLRGRDFGFRIGSLVEILALRLHRLLLPRRHLSFKEATPQDDFVDITKQCSETM